jgi:hypothetical protein
MQFNAKVKSDPTGQLSGSYQCTVTADALLLQRKKQTVMSIPRGTPTTRTPAANEIAVQLPTGPLVLALGKFAVYPTKLADAVAAFLSGSRPTVDQADVKIEPYLLIPSVAPFGIMILTRGGAIWGALGGGIACACLAIAQAESVPRAGRVALILVINVALYAGIIALVMAAPHQ